MYKTYLYSTLTVLLYAAMAIAAPRLTVVVIADGLRQENLDRLQPYLNQGGLRLLAEEGSSTVIHFNHEVFGGAETTATLLSGEAPATHGIPMDSCFSRTDKAIHPVLEDNTEKPISATGPLSPRALLTPVLADHFRYIYGKEAKIYAIGQTPATSIVMAGHAANGCCWLDPKTTLWGTTSFYGAGLPTVADACNIGGQISRLEETEWQPRMEISMYMSPSERETRKKGFTYRHQKPLHCTPAINTLIVEMVLKMQDEENLGMDDTPDLILVQLTTRTPRAESDFILSAEQEDMYLALNQDLGFMLEQLQRKLGKENIDVWVAGVPKLGLSASMLNTSGMPTRQFFTDRAAALTSAYLMALYGHEKWVEGCYGFSLYLNRSLIEQKRMSLSDIQQQVADFLMDFEGVQVAHPMHLAYLDPQMRHSLCKRSTGDVVFTLQPGWQLGYTEGDITDHVVETHPTVPLLLLSHKNEKLTEIPMDAQAVLPLMLKILTEQ